LVRLEPLSRDHLPQLLEIGLDERIWRWMPVLVNGAADLRTIVETALANQAAGRELAFATIERAGGRVVGSTRYLNIEPAHRRLEIGYTWLAPAWQKTAINSAAKLLMLEHAFERLGAVRVEFKTDALNAPSRRALAGIGAVEEGVLRRHMIVQAGRLRDSAYFSVIAAEWPVTRRHLEQRIERLGPPD
jgi:RimJ/RimL family protein N-acetyltransferase